jgi:hypothetical protein
MRISHRSKSIRSDAAVALTWRSAAVVSSASKLGSSCSMSVATTSSCPARTASAACVSSRSLAAPTRAPPTSRNCSATGSSPSANDRSSSAMLSRLPGGAVFDHRSRDRNRLELEQTSIDQVADEDHMPLLRVPVGAVAVGVAEFLQQGSELVGTPVYVSNDVVSRHRPSLSAMSTTCPRTYCEHKGDTMSVTSGTNSWSLCA